MHNNIKATATTVLVIIGHNDAPVGTMTVKEVEANEETRNATDRTDKPFLLAGIPDLEAFRPPKKRGRYWESPKFPFKGKRR